MFINALLTTQVSLHSFGSISLVCNQNYYRLLSHLTDTQYLRYAAVMGWLKGVLTGVGALAAAVGIGAVVLFGPVGVVMNSVTAAGGGVVVPLNAIMKLFSMTSPQ